MTGKCAVLLNLAEICRLCLSEEGNKMPIFKKMDCESDVSLAAKITSCLAIEVMTGDGLPELICQKCTSRINGWYSYKEQCQSLDTYLRDHVKKIFGGANESNAKISSGNTDSGARKDGCRKLLEHRGNATKKRVTSTSRKKCSGGVKEENVAEREMGYLNSLCDVILEEPAKDENEDVSAKSCQMELEKMNLKTDKENTENEFSLTTTTPSRAFTCKVCQRTFASKLYLQDHEVTHSGDKKFACKDCDKMFYSERKLKLHLKTHSLERSCLCSVCGKSFREKSDLKRHFRLHSDESPFLCNICGKTFKTKFYLNRHLMTHSGEKKYTCSECGKAFRWRDTLLVHAKVHALERPLPCGVCGKGFKRKDDLIRHTRIHTGEKPFVCPYCKRCFSDKWNLTQHVRLHTGQKPYVCSVCNKAFTHNVTLRKHIKLHHPNIT